MELVSARLLEHLAGDVDFEVVAGDGLETLPAGMLRTRVLIPSRPSLARLVVFDLVGTVRLARVRRRCDLVHSCGAVAHSSVDLVTVHLSHASVIEAQGGARPPGRGGVRGLGGAVRRRLAARLEHWTMRPEHVRRIAALSPTDARDLQARYPELPVVVVENGADLDTFEAVPRHTRTSGQPLSVVVVAGDFERKGVALAIQAIATTKRCRLRVIGSGDLDAMRRLATQLGAADRVELVGHLSDVASGLTGADVVLSCSAHESFGLSLVEGAAARCAVVTTSTGIGPELVGASGDGGVLIGRDPKEIARALDELDADPARCTSMGEVAAKRAASFTWDRMAASTLALYRSLAATR
jgi:glycosyltransferase involved in cell wall biosynthesis